MDNSDLSLPTFSPSDLDTSGNPEHKGFLESMSGHAVEFIETFVVIGAIFALIYLFIAQPHKVSGKSMFSTFDDGDFIFTDKISYRLGEIKRGDVIVLKNPRNESQDFIKRIIVLPGETVKIENSMVYINGKPLNETYLPPATFTRPGAFIREGEEIKAGENQYFVFGDNREHSSDSRAWGGVKKEEIVGKVFFRYWPPQAFGLIK